MDWLGVGCAGKVWLSAVEAGSDDMKLAAVLSVTFIVHDGPEAR